MKTDTVILYEGMRLLQEHLGLVEAEKFIALINREPFDYTKWQQTLWDERSVDELFEIARRQNSEYEEKS